MRLVEPTKVCANPDCARAGERQPWSNFYAKVKWPDGTMRQPHSRCKACSHASTNAQHRAKRLRDPEWWRKRRARHYANLRSNPERWAADLARRREWKRSAHGYRRNLHRHADVGVMEDLLSEPFAGWLRHVMERDGVTQNEAAIRLGIGEKTLREILKGRRVVKLATVERALIADDTITLRELYPSLYAEAA